MDHGKVMSLTSVKEHMTQQFTMDHENVTSWISAKEHMITMNNKVATKIARTNCAKNAQIPALGYVAFEDEKEREKSPIA